MKNKKILLIAFVLAILVLTGAFCGKGSPTTTGGGKTTGGGGEGGGLAGGVGKGGFTITDMCSQISKEFVGQALSKTIVRTEPGPGQPDYCQYFTRWSQDFYKLPDGKTMPGGDFVSLNYDNFNVEDQKKGQEYLGRKIETNDKIKMEHFLVIQEDGLINTIYLVIDPNHFVSVDRSSGKVISEEEVVDFAAKVAELLEKGVPAPKPPEQAPSQIEKAKEFFQFLADKKIDEALAMMDANESTKKMWKTNFDTIKSLSVKKVEPVFLEEWTSTRQVFRFDLLASVTSEGEGYGWNQGQNARWLSLQKNNEVWQVHEIASNP